MMEKKDPQEAPSSVDVQTSSMDFPTKASPTGTGGSSEQTSRAACFDTHRSWILFTFSFLVTSMAAGVVYGWPSLRRQLHEDGSSLDERQLGAIFAIGAWSSQGGRFFEGIARDHLGTRVVICACLGLVAMGSIGLGLSDPNNMMALGASIFLTGLGSGIHLCVQPVAGLFPLRTGIVISVLTGAFLVSGLVFLILTVGEVSRKVAFCGYAGCLVALAVGSWFLFPQGSSYVLPEERKDDLICLDEGTEHTQRTHPLRSSTSIFSLADLDASFGNLDAPQGNLDAAETIDPRFFSLSPVQKGDKGNDDDDQQDDIESCLSTITEQKAKVESDSSSGKSTTELAKQVVGVPSSVPTLRQQMLSVEYILLVTWFFICVVPLQYYVGIIGHALEEMGDHSGFFTDAFALIYAGSALVSPLTGLVTDKLGLGLGQGLATLLLCVALLILAFDTISLQVQTVGMVFYGISRIFIYSVYFTNVAKRFGYKNFGSLAGFGLLVSALGGVFQYLLIAWVAEGNIFMANLVLTGILILQAPYFVWLYQREKTPPGALKRGSIFR